MPLWLLVPERETLGTRRPRVLALPRDGTAGWTLPRIGFPRDAWVAASVGQIADRAHGSIGLRATVLRHLVHLEQGHVCQLEAHDPQWQPPAGSRWVGLDELRALDQDVWQHAEAVEAIERWFGEQVGTVPVPDIRPPWERRGWVNDVLRWADEQIGRLGTRRTGPPRQVKGAWSGSAILRLPTSDGDLYLKSAYTRPPGEARLVAALAARWPDALPEVVAHDAGRNLLLMRDFGKGTLEGAPAPRWENAARGFGALQLACSAHLDEWLAMGCEDRRLHTLMPHFDRLLADTPYLWLGHEHPRALTSAQLAQVRAQLPQLRELVQQLGAYGIPDSLVQQDFRHGNLAVVPRDRSPDSPNRFVYYDWGDTVVSHPFFSGTRMLDFVGRALEREVRGPSGLAARVTYSRDAMHRYLRDAYVEPWTTLLPARELRAAFEVARALNPLWQTVRWWLEIPYYETTSPWGKDSLTWGPHHLRRLIREMGEEPAQAAKS